MCSSDLLNESPYSGRRNGVESAAQTYFGKSSKDLTLPECSLLAAIPNNPSLYNPYNTYGRKALVERQHKILDDMMSMNYISKQEAAAAKKVDIMDTIKPLADQYANVKAPHFVQTLVFHGRVRPGPAVEIAHDKNPVRMRSPHPEGHALLMKYRAHTSNPARIVP